MMTVLELLCDFHLCFSTLDDFIDSGDFFLSSVIMSGSDSSVVDSTITTGYWLVDFIWQLLVKILCQSVCV